MYQLALRSVMYSSDGELTQKAVTITINDGVSVSIALRTIEQAGVNDPPVLRLESSSLKYTENQASVYVTSTLMIDDVDSVIFQGATVKISSNYEKGLDLLNSSVTEPGQSFDAVSGTLTFAGAHSKLCA